MITLPRLLGSAWAASGDAADLLAGAWSEADVLEVGAACVAILAVAFPILAVALLLARLLKQLVGAVWSRTAGHPVRRALAGVVAVGLVAGLASAWWPQPGAYRPVQPYEGGTLQQAGRAVVQTVLPARMQPTRLATGEYGQMVTGMGDRRAPADPRPPTARGPRGPTRRCRRRRRSGIGTHRPGHRHHSRAEWRCHPRYGYRPRPGRRRHRRAPMGVPVRQAAAARAGDNQALAVNTTDNTVTYDVAFALVWVEGDVPALNRNEAYAFASCTGCAAVSIGFQVVLVLGDNHVAAPQNISAAVNYDCVNCMTYALATQLFVTLNGPLSDAAASRAGRPVAPDRRLRRPHHRGPALRDPVQAHRVRAADPAGHREGPRPAHTPAGDDDLARRLG